MAQTLTPKFSKAFPVVRHLASIIVIMSPTLIENHSSFKNHSGLCGTAPPTRKHPRVEEIG